jgi:hypothetical protein
MGFLGQLGEGCNTFQLARPTCETFHRHEVLARHYGSLSSRERHSQGALVDGVKVERLLDEQVDGEPRIFRVPERKYRQGAVEVLVPQVKDQIKVQRGAQGGKNSLDSAALIEGNLPGAIGQPPFDSGARE